jgi:hypothetical protein
MPRQLRDPREKRKWERKRFRTALPVWIDKGDGSPWILCAIEDISDGGARLKLTENGAVLPESFVLRLSMRDRVGKRCRLCWRSPTALGVEYQQPKRPPQSIPAWPSELKSDRI